MEKQRKIKILSIVALVLAICALTLGYAAFSTTLNISSSASVSPNSDDFKMVVYGFTNSKDVYDVIDGMWVFNSSGLSLNSTLAINNGSVITSDVVIDNSTNSISNLSADFDDSSDFYSWLFVFRNEGKYTSYLSRSDVEFFTSPTECQAVDNVNPELLDNACSFLNVSGSLINKETDEFDNFVFHPNEYGIFVLTVSNDSGTIADGAFTAKFPDIMLNFSTSAQKHKSSFFIFHEEYEMEIGMTWDDWLNSSYNTGDFVASGNYVKDMYDYIAEPGSECNKVKLSDLIKIDGNYEHVNTECN